MKSTSMSLRAQLASVLSDSPLPSPVRGFVETCHAMAVVCLRGRLRSDNHHPSTTGLSVEDIATDCLGSLFERTSGGEFRLLRHYYEEARWDRLSDAELVSCTRRLVFSRVHQELCRLWKQGDPSLQKLLRNFKNTLRTNRRLVTRRIGHDAWLFVQASVHEPAILPEMSAEYFEAHLTPRLQAGMSMRRVSAAVVAVLDEQGWYRKGLPLISVALGIRNCFVRLVPSASAEEPEFPDDRRPLLDAAVHAVQARMSPSYVGRGKVDPATLALYLRSVFDILHDQYILENGDGRTFYDYLCMHRPGTTRSEYRRTHQGHLEYLVKLTKQEFFASVERELD
jgi:hypothetical protein